ncbi:MAG: DUF5615 family PIN-like protein [Ignavibacteriaceae bacterium]
MEKNGQDVIHTDDLPNKERTSDSEIRNIAQQEKRIVITKDVDFLNSFHLQNTPERLLIITTGNIKNRKLFELVLNNLEKIEELFDEYKLVELNNREIIGHE